MTNSTANTGKPLYVAKKGLELENIKLKEIKNDKNINKKNKSKVYR